MQRPSMFEGATPERIASMSAQELRWLHNVKKAFHDSDTAYLNGRHHDRCFPEICNAVDTAKTLHRSLCGAEATTRGHRNQFLEFLNLEIPDKSEGGGSLELIHARSGCDVEYTFAELIYDIRCMIHENENLNADEMPHYHIVLDWSARDQRILGTIVNGHLTCNAYLVWKRVRQILAKFITFIDGMHSFSQGGAFRCTVEPPLGSIHP